MTLHYNVTGERRKELVTAMAEILDCKAEYLKMPTRAYKVDYFTIDPNGNVSFDDFADSEEIENLIDRLAEKGFTAEPAENGTEGETGFTVSYPRSKISDAGIERLKKLLNAKGALIKKALNIENLSVDISEDRVSFPWFGELPTPDEIEAYSRFICALCAFAEKQKRVTAKEKATDNEKFAFRTFLLRLGFIGNEPELKKARKVLLSRLSGSSAFRSGSKSAEEAEQ